VVNAFQMNILMQPPDFIGDVQWDMIGGRNGLCEYEILVFDVFKRTTIKEMPLKLDISPSKPMHDPEFISF